MNHDNDTYHYGHGLINAYWVNAGKDRLIRVCAMATDHHSE